MRRRWPGSHPAQGTRSQRNHQHRPLPLLARRAVRRARGESRGGAGDRPDVPGFLAHAPRGAGDGGREARHAQPASARREARPREGHGEPVRARDAHLRERGREQSDTPPSAARPCPRRRRPRRARDGLLPLREWPGAPTVPLHVYRASIELRRGQTTVLARTLFQLDMAPGPTWQHYFPPAHPPKRAHRRLHRARAGGLHGQLWIRLWERGWDTRKVPNGSYTLKLTVEDTVGRSASKTLRLRVAN